MEGKEPEQLRIGDLILYSYRFDVSQLAGLAINILQDKTIREYLDIVKKKSAMNYTG